MLRKRFGYALVQADYALACEEEAAHHYGYGLSAVDCELVWIRGFLVSWHEYPRLASILA